MQGEDGASARMAEQTAIPTIEKWLMTTSPPETTEDDVTCTVCGCVCDDLRLTISNDRITCMVPACPLAESWFLNQSFADRPAAEVRGRAVSFAKALTAAASILKDARHPLIYGLSRSSTSGQRAAVRLADRLGATIDTTASRCHAPSIMALQEVGESTCSLGEIRNRADLVIYWGANPVASHPRHLERYALWPSGRFISGREQRTLVVVDIAPTATSSLADHFLQVDPAADFEVIWTLRSLIQGVVPDIGATIGGMPLTQLQRLAERMKSCRCGVVFFGLGLTKHALGHRTVEALLRLVNELNDHTRFHAKRMRIPGDVTGADSVLCWQTGYPFAVNLQRGFPRHNPGEYSANELLERREVDACLLVGSEGIGMLSPMAQQSLRDIPTIILDYPQIKPPFEPSVRFTTAIYGIHRSGTAYRMDEVPIPLKAVLPSDYPDDSQVLTSLVETIAQLHTPL